MFGEPDELRDIGSGENLVERSIESPVYLLQGTESSCGWPHCCVVGDWVLEGGLSNVPDLLVEGVELGFDMLLSAYEDTSGCGGIKTGGRAVDGLLFLFP